MERKPVNGKDLDKIVGGSIMISEDGTTCGRNCTDQYKILDFDAIVDYVRANSGNMPEKKIMANMVELGYITPLT